MSTEDLFKEMCRAADGFAAGVISDEALHSAVVDYTDAFQLDALKQQRNLPRQAYIVEVTAKLRVQARNPLMAARIADDIEFPLLTASEGWSYVVRDLNGTELYAGDAQDGL